MSQLPRWPAFLTVAVAVSLAILHPILQAIGFDWAAKRYDPSTAVLTATLLAIIAYTYFTARSVEATERMAELQTIEARERMGEQLEELEEHLAHMHGRSWNFIKNCQTDRKLASQPHNNPPSYLKRDAIRKARRLARGTLPPIRNLTLTAALKAEDVIELRQVYLNRQERGETPDRKDAEQLIAAATRAQTATAKALKASKETIRNRSGLI